jgi:glycerate kinase
MALGWQFLDENGLSIGAGGEELQRIKKIIPPSDHHMPPVEVLCDVDNPLCGPHGAAAVYGPQKGATPEMVEILDNALDNLAARVKEQLGVDVKNIPGSGAAGGMAAGAIAFMNGRLVSGIETVMEQSRLEQSIAHADWVITGEGRFDHQSLRGKVVHGIAKMAGKYGTKVAVLAGQVTLSPDEYRQCGITDAVSCMTDDMSVEYAIGNAASLLTRAAETFAARHLINE